MYKSKVRSRKEAFEYTVEKLPKAKAKSTILTNYARAISSLPVGTPTIVVPTIQEMTTHQAFKYSEGQVPINTIVINEDGTILI